MFSQVIVGVDGGSTGRDAVAVARLLVFDTSGSVLGDSITGLGFSICFYYGFTGLACVVYYRREIFRSVHRTLLVGLVPLLGFAGMAFIFIKAAHDYSKAGANYSAPLLGVQVPIVIGIGGLLLGVVFMIAQWISRPEFFRRGLQTANPQILEDHLSHSGT